MRNKKPELKNERGRFVCTPKEAANGTMLVKTIGRNEPCPCGSGKKNKDCCRKYKAYYYIPKR